MRNGLQDGLALNKPGLLREGIEHLRRGDICRCIADLVAV